MLILVVVIFLVNLIITEPVSGIQCYSCESASETNCGEVFSMEEYFKIDCDQVAPPRYLSNDIEYLNATACMKKVYKENKVLKYVRSCYFGDVNDTKIGCRMDPTMMDFQDVQCLVCDRENFCNKAVSSKTMYKSLIICASSFVMILLKRSLY